MICDSNFEARAKNGKKGSQSLVKAAIEGKSYIILTTEELKRFLNEHEIIHCAEFLQDSFSYEKLLRIYFLLFQVCASYGHKEAIFNFVKQYQFLEKLNQVCPSNWNKSQLILSTKISKFLDSFKQGICQKHQLNSLINEYHEFRLLQSTKQGFILSTCKLIKEYIHYNLNLLLTELEYTDWIKMNEESFQKFYKHFCQLCTICKRVSYIKCTLFNLPVYEVPCSIRNRIEARHLECVEGKNEMETTSEVEKKESQKIQGPVLSVRKKLKAMNTLISKMEQRI